MNGRPITAARFALIEGPLKEKVDRYNPDFKDVISVLGVTSEKYGLFENIGAPSLIMVSKGEYDPKNNKNVFFTVSSYQDVINRFIIDDFQRKTGIELRPTPPGLERVMQSVGMCLPIFERVGNEAFDILKKMGL